MPRDKDSPSTKEIAEIREFVLGYILSKRRHEDVSVKDLFEYDKQTFRKFTTYKDSQIATWQQRVHRHAKKTNRFFKKDVPDWDEVMAVQMDVKKNKPIVIPADDFDEEETDIPVQRERQNSLMQKTPLSMLISTNKNQDLINFNAAIKRKASGKDFMTAKDPMSPRERLSLQSQVLKDHMNPPFIIPETVWASLNSLATTVSEPIVSKSTELLLTPDSEVKSLSVQDQGDSPSTTYRKRSLDSLINPVRGPHTDEKAMEREIPFSKLQSMNNDLMSPILKATPDTITEPLVEIPSTVTKETDLPLMTGIQNSLPVVAETPSNQDIQGFTRIAHDRPSSIKENLIPKPVEKLSVNSPSSSTRTQPKSAPLKDATMSNSNVKSVCRSILPKISLSERSITKIPNNTALILPKVTSTDKSVISSTALKDNVEPSINLTPKDGIPTNLSESSDKTDFSTKNLDNQQGGLSNEPPKQVNVTKKPQSNSSHSSLSSSGTSTTTKAKPVYNVPKKIAKLQFSLSPAKENKRAVWVSFKKNFPLLPNPSHLSDDMIEKFASHLKDVNQTTHNGTNCLTMLDILRTHIEIPEAGNGMETNLTSTTESSHSIPLPTVENVSSTSKDNPVLNNDSSINALSSEINGLSIQVDDAYQQMENSMDKMKNLSESMEDPFTDDFIPFGNNPIQPVESLSKNKQDQIVYTDDTLSFKNKNSISPVQTTYSPLVIANEHDQSNDFETSLIPCLPPLVENTQLDLHESVSKNNAIPDDDLLLLPHPSKENNSLDIDQFISSVHPVESSQLQVCKIPNNNISPYQTVAIASDMKERKVIVETPYRDFQDHLSSEDLAKIKRGYKQICKKDKIVLKSGTVIEDEMEFAAESIPFEQSSAVHSFIFDVEDDLWDNLAAFTDEDTEEIQKMKSNAFIEKPDKNLNYVFHLLKGKTSFDSLYTAISSIEVHPHKTPELYWIKETLINALRLFTSSPNISLSNFSHVGDLLDNVFGFIEKIKYAVTASSLKGISHGRDLISGKKQGPDSYDDETIHLTLKYNSLRMLYTEADFQDKGICDPKYLHARHLRVPKMLKDFLSEAIDKYPQSRKTIKSIGFIINGFSICGIYQECTSGSTTLIKESARLHFPESLAEFAVKIRPIIHLLYNTILILDRNVESFRDDNEDYSLGKRKQSITPSFSSKRARI